MPVHKLPVIMVSNVQKKCQFHTQNLEKISPSLWPPLTNLGCTTVTEIAKMHKGAMPPPPPIDRRVIQKKKERKRKMFP